MHPDPVGGLPNKQVDNLFRICLQGLCINSETHETQPPTAVFKKLDKYGAGTVDYDEFCAALKEASVFMGENEKKMLWATLDSEDEGEIYYSIFDDYMESIGVPRHFWVIYVVPYQVEKTGKGDPWGHVDVEHDEVSTWMYFLNDDETWDCVPKGDE
mmetsp:Transcript_46144/g.72210  ORF Transcript_46144/g.72210 Transcript_46144/m.72210 type:complete len:157 (-) Transcript_46144:813-1283(-)